jgi:hypothetical protein
VSKDNAIEAWAEIIGDMLYQVPHDMRAAKPKPP